MKELNITISTNHLMECIEAVYYRSGIVTHFSSVKEIIASDENSAAFIREVLDDESFSALEHENPLFEFAKSRAQHSVLTFFIGLVFLDFCDFRREIANTVLNSYNEKDVISLWMLTALYHDWGYHSNDLTKMDLDFRKIIKYDLLTDDYKEESWLQILQDFSRLHPHILAYTYDEIKNYDRYARSYHAKYPNDTEKVDHGILGGMKIFDRLVKRIGVEVSKDVITSSTQKRLLCIKIACLTIAQHNIFKSSSVENDKNYGIDLRKLHSTSDFKISMDTPLLLLLSLVDTFECIKRFGQAKNESKYLQKNTILESITLGVSPQIITIDYSNLSDKIQKKDTNLHECFTKYINGLYNIGTWTSFSCKQGHDGIVTINLNKAPLQDAFSNSPH